jgi:hypothetical protein
MVHYPPHSVRYFRVSYLPNVNVTWRKVLLIFPPPIRHHPRRLMMQCTGHDPYLGILLLLLLLWW